MKEKPGLGVSFSPFGVALLSLCGSISFQKKRGAEIGSGGVFLVSGKKREKRRMLVKRVQGGCHFVFFFFLCKPRAIACMLFVFAKFEGYTKVNGRAFLFDPHLVP